MPKVTDSEQYALSTANLIKDNLQLNYYVEYIEYNMGLFILPLISALEIHIPASTPIFDLVLRTRSNMGVSAGIWISRGRYCRQYKKTHVILDTYPLFPLSLVLAEHLLIFQRTNSNVLGVK